MRRPRCSCSARCGRRPARPPVYAVELVAAPAPTPTEAGRARGDADAAARRSRPRSSRKPKPPPKAPAPSRSPSRRRRPTRRPRAAAADPGAGRRPLPGETPSTGTDVATIKTPGLEFPYPEYLRNIVNQVYRRWDRDDGAAEQLRRDQLPDPARRLGARHPVRHPLGQLRLRPRARRAPSRPPATPARSVRCRTAGTPTSCP